MSDYTNDPEWKAWEARAHEELVPKLEDSAAVMSLVPKGQTDIKFAVELGLSIMLDKPILAVVQPGAVVPPKLRRVADKIIEVDLETEEGRMRAQEDLTEFMRMHG